MVTLFDVLRAAMARPGGTPKGARAGFMRESVADFDAVLDAVCDALFAPGDGTPRHAEAPQTGGRVSYRFVPLPDGTLPPAAAGLHHWERALAWLGLDEAGSIWTDPPGDELTAERLDALSAAELKQIRRAFALKFHPDRCDPGRRDAATRQMTQVNMLIDTALQRKKAG